MPRISGELPAPPEAGASAARIAKRLVSPVERFLHVEASSGIVLVVVAAVAMLIANSTWREAYHHALELPISFGVGPHDVERSLHFWINDGLMTVFFFVVGLEIRREMHGGELSNIRRAALPAAAALGGMVAPALLYLAIAGGRPENRPGWGMPMATDIAFAVGILALLGRRVPPALRVLLLALAIIDDIGSIIVVAIFYSGPVSPSGFVIVAGGVITILGMQRIAIRRVGLYVVPGVVIWFGFLRAGVHPTLGGVLVGLLTPARSWLGAEGFVRIARKAAGDIEDALASGTPDHIEPERLAEETGLVDLARREALAPAVRLQLALHPIVAFLVMPLFAFANAGVPLGSSLTSMTKLSIGVVVGLVVGKPLGVIGACAIAVKLGVARLPLGIRWREMSVLGLVAGIGFTMALFIASLAFPEGEKLEEAKSAILIASTLAILAALAIGRLVLRPAGTVAGAAATAAEAECTDDA